MTRVNGADQVLMLLRQQLQRIDRGRGRNVSGSAKVGPGTPRPLDRLHDLAALDGISDEEFRRLVVRALLTEELGEQVANDPAFQSVLGEVVRIIEDSEEGRALVARAAGQLRGRS